MSRIKLIASDLDGTLLLNGAQKLQPNTSLLIHELTKRGIVFLAASGRQYASLRKLFYPICTEIAYICENGCLSFFEEEMIHRVEMDRAMGQEIIRTIMERGDSEALVSGVNTCYIQPKDPAFYHLINDEVGNNTTVVPDILATEEPYMKISVYEKAGVRDEAYWAERFGDRAEVVTSGHAWLDLMPKGVNKALALSKILEKLEIDPEECVAFGDNYNDREMLEMVGRPVVMETGKPEIKALTKEHTDTVEHYLEKLLVETD